MSNIIPYIPQSITVHLGPPSSSAANVTVSFADYIKNVASGEIYPTWEESALRSNILAIVSFALNRVYTEFYRSRGAVYDITASTAFDQSFSENRNIFENISQLVDELFNDYLRKSGNVEPLAAAFCNGTTVTCDGMSQWGSQNLATQGYNSVEILRAYYGDEVEIVMDAPVAEITASYPGAPLREGDAGPNVLVIQASLNRISQNYPAIAKINPVDGLFDAGTTASVRKFQQIFNLSVDGVVGKATWYQLVKLYVAVKKLAELSSEGQAYSSISWAYPDAIVEGDQGVKVSHLQYMLAVLATFYPRITPVVVTGDFDAATKSAVLAFQQLAGLALTGEVGAKSWDAIYDAYAGVAQTVLSRGELFPYRDEPFPANTIRILQEQLRVAADCVPQLTPPSLSGRLDTITRQAVRSFQQAARLPATGQVDETTKLRLAAWIGESRYARCARPTQFPGFDLRFGMVDPAQEVQC